MSTYVPIQAITPSSPASSVIFSGIPQTFTDLILVINGGMNTTTGYATALKFNSDSSSNYSSTYMIGNGSTATSGRYSSTGAMYVGGPAKNNLNGNIIIHIQNYSNATTNKIILVRSNRAADDVWAVVGSWRQNSAITQIEISPEFVASWLAGSTFTLYGFGTGSPKAFGGTTVRTDGTYWYHTFQSSGVFEPLENLSNVDYLVVAGGGGGANGGGGAGGFRTSAGTSGANSSAESKLSLVKDTKYIVTIGAGGSPVSWADSGNNGSSSTFNTITSLGGGGGGGPNAAGKDGGSGGGAGNISAGGVPAPGNGTANQGLGGGSAVQNGNNQSGGGGGGGASSAGVSFGSGGAGGSGLASTISGSSVSYAGGGGAANIAGAGGTGGGGAGGSGTGGAGTNGTANTGGGGGGSIFGTHGAGGSGIVIVRYPV